MESTESLNKVDAHVAKSLLQYPLLYSSRQQVLSSLFLTLGNGYRWDENGCVQTECDTKVFDGITDLSDLDESDKNFASDREYDRFIRAQNELERQTRLFRANNISLFAKFGSHVRGETYSVDRLRNWSPNYGILSTAPFGNIDSDWVRAIEEFLDGVFVAFNQTYSLHFDKPLSKGGSVPSPSMFSRMPSDMQEKHTALKSIAEKVEAQTGNAARRLAFVMDIMKRREEKQEQ